MLKHIHTFHCLILSLLLVSIWGDLKAQESKQGVYFDENNHEISRNQFKKKIRSGNYLSIPGDPPNSSRLAERANTGSLTNPLALYQFLSHALDMPLDTNNPIVILFHPGKDSCNSGGTADPNVRTKWHLELEEGLQQVAKVSILHLYKDPDGLEQFDQRIIWKKDPDSTIEGLFFRHHYPCGSFVVFSGKANYISYFGEYPKEFVWNAVQILDK